MSQQDDSSTNCTQSKPLKKITARELLNNLDRFIQEFQEFDPKTVVSTPQADLGIGPVKYDLKFRTDQRIKKSALRKLNMTIELEKSIGDKLVKFDASMLFLASGKEDPYAFLPPACRATIRTEIKEATVKTVEENQLASLKILGDTMMNDFIRKYDKHPRSANPLEVTLLRDLADSLDPRISQFGTYQINSLLEKRQKERQHAERTRKIIRKIFKRGAYEAMKMAELKELDDAADMHENKKNYSQGQTGRLAVGITPIIKDGKEAKQ